jgi:2-oxoglutarate ferredoxin oxidoreductase subunit beta
VDRPVYDTQMADQLDTAIEQNGKGDLAALLTGNDTWTVENTHDVRHRAALR